MKRYFGSFYPESVRYPRQKFVHILQNIFVLKKKE